MIKKGNRTANTRNIQGFIWRKRIDMDGRQYNTLEMSYDDFAALGIEVDMKIHKHNSYTLYIDGKEYTTFTGKKKP